MSLLGLPPEVRACIYDFVFPPKHSQVQLIPYDASSASCHLNLPLALYRVCKQIYSELPPLDSKLRSLDIVHVIQDVLFSYESGRGSGKDHDDPDVCRLLEAMRYAERVRIVGGSSPYEYKKRIVLSAVDGPVVGPECALRVLEVQPVQWNMERIRDTVTSFGCMTIHPNKGEVNIAKRVRLRLILDERENGDTDEILKLLQRYQDCLEKE